MEVERSDWARTRQMRIGLDARRDCPRTKAGMVCNATTCRRSAGTITIQLGARQAPLGPCPAQSKGANELRDFPRRGRPQALYEHELARRRKGRTTNGHPGSACHTRRAPKQTENRVAALGGCLGLASTPRRSRSSYTCNATPYSGK
eukprot:6872366-Pyramimonas_sp.AAC.1